MARSTGLIAWPVRKLIAEVFLGQVELRLAVAAEGDLARIARLVEDAARLPAKVPVARSSTSR